MPQNAPKLGFLSPKSSREERNSRISAASLAGEGKKKEILGGFGIFLCGKCTNLGEIWGKLNYFLFFSTKKRMGEDLPAPKWGDLTQNWRVLTQNERIYPKIVILPQIRGFLPKMKEFYPKIRGFYPKFVIIYPKIMILPPNERILPQNCDILHQIYDFPQIQGILPPKWENFTPKLENFTLNFDFSPNPGNFTPKWFFCTHWFSARVPLGGGGGKLGRKSRKMGIVKNFPRNSGNGEDSPQNSLENQDFGSKNRDFGSK